MKTGRNQPCPCGSGRKHKHCCAGSPLEMMTPQTAPAGPVSSEAGLSGPQRRCDGCTACCGPALTLNEPGLVAPQGEPCPNLGGCGCAIYGESMPATCTGYVCNYLREPARLTRAERPDQVGAIVRLAPDRSTYVNECAPGGLERVLQNRFWGGAIRQNLMAGNPILLSWLDDPLNREIVKLRRRDGRFGCELTSCTADGSPILERRQPEHDRQIHFTRVIPGQDFAFDPEVLSAELGTRDQAVIEASRSASTATDLHFLFTRRQAGMIEALRVLIDRGPTLGAFTGVARMAIPAGG